MNLKKYHGSIDFTVLNNSHTQAFLFLQEHCQASGSSNPRVLEVGCSGGYFSEALRNHNIYVYAIEPFSTEAKDAGRVDMFFHGTVEDFCINKFTNLYESFDAIIMGDVLEHLLDPKSTLRALSKYLNKDGVFIVSIPNITHIGIQRMLEDQQWTYRKYGILDSTHVRFFSWPNVVNMFIDIGFGIERRYDVLMPEFKVYPTLNSYRDFIFGADLKPGDHTFQFVVRASRKAFATGAFVKSFPQNILLISPDPRSSLTVLRLIKPLLEYLSDVGGDLKVVGGQGCTVDFLRWADVILIHREVSIYTFEFLRLARRQMIPIVYDIDDLLTKLPPWSLAHISPTDVFLMEDIMATADRVTCTTKHLQQEILKISDKVCVVPNTITTHDKTRSPRDRHYSTDCTLIIASSDNVIVEFLLLPVQTLCKAIPSLRVVAIGNIAHHFDSVASNLTKYPLCSEDNFSKILNNIDNGIGLIPLDGSLASSCKSPIKYYHYTSCGIVTVASAVPPYSDCIVNNENGLLVENNLDTWCNSVFKLVTDFKLRQTLLANAIKSWVKNGSSKTAKQGWKRAFLNLPRKIKHAD